MTVAPSKDAMRKAALARRDAARDDALSLHAAGVLAEFLAPHAGKPVAGYLPIKSEIDPIPALIAVAVQSPICLPEVVASGAPLVFREWRDGEALAHGAFGTRHPAHGAVMTPQVVIVPLVGFDRQGHRLGYGGGFYDRTLAALRAAGEVLAVGFAYAAQEVPDIPAEPTDVALDAVVTEAGVIPMR